MEDRNRPRWVVASLPLLVGVCLVLVLGSTWGGAGATAPSSGIGVNEAGATGEYVVLSWNDLGMHCYNRNFQDIGVLPPYNSLWAQVIRVGDPPQIVTGGIRVEYKLEDNTYSAGKSDFWAISPYRPVQNAQWLFGLAEPLPVDTGLTGFGLSGEMEARGDHFVAEGIPLTEFSDSAPTTPDPYQLATVIVYDESTGQELARANPVAPVSTEMHCNNCHYDNGPGNEGIATGVVEQNILMAHDEEVGGEYPRGHEGPLMDRRPVLCAECHASNALGAPGVPGVPNLSKAIHEKHKDKVPASQEGCYNCHPGPQTQCLRDVMSTEYGMDCVSCHGDLEQVVEKQNPWLEEPRCDNAACHGSAYQQDQALYRLSKGHGDVYCAACHDSPHAIAPSSQPNDAIKFVALQGHAGTLQECTVCHLTQPAGAGPHGAGAVMPTAVPTARPTTSPTAVPTLIPTAVPTLIPTASPTASSAREAVHVGDIQTSFRRTEESRYRLRGVVPILDGAGNPVARAKVKVEWERPDGSRQDADAETGSNGQVVFSLDVSRQGTYILRVLRVEKSGYEYAPNLNLETSEVLSIP